jgi:hypothetical protein
MWSNNLAFVPLQKMSCCQTCYACEIALEVPALAWSSYDRTWFSGPDKQEIFVLVGPGPVTLAQFIRGFQVKAW